jgi:hypothetical protein
LGDLGVKDKEWAFETALVRSQPAVTVFGGKAGYIKLKKVNF